MKDFIEIKVKLFGPQAKLAGEKEISIGLPAPVTVAQLRGTLALFVPSLAPSLPSSRFAVNQEFASDDDTVGPADEVALIGMVSGG